MDLSGIARQLLQDAPLDCSASRDTCSSTDHPQDWAIGALFIICLSSTLGVALPWLGTRLGVLSLKGFSFFTARAFAAGVVLATGFIHVLNDSVNLLGNPCLAWGSYPWAMAITTASALFTCMLEFVGGSFLSASGGQSHGAAHFEPPAEPQTVPDPEAGVEEPAKKVGQRSFEEGRRLAVAQVLELGIALHSVLIGIGLGASSNVCTIRSLTAALTFHQFFEGIALGGALLFANFRGWGYAAMAAVFTLTTPTGVAIGLAIKTGYNENSPTALVVEGVFDAVSAGILIYMALVDLVAVDFFSPQVRNLGPFRQLVAFAALFLGAFALGLIGKWA